MRTDIKYISITGVLLLILLTASSEESGWENIVGTNKYLQIEGEIAGTDVVTKVTGDDLGTNIRFTEGDQIGFYSFHKNKCAGGTQSSHHGEIVEENGIGLFAIISEHDEPIHVGIRQKMGWIRPGNGRLAGSSNNVILIVGNVLVFTCK